MKIYQTLNSGIKIVEYEESLAQTLADMWNQSREVWGGDSGLKTAENIKSRHAGVSHYNVYIAMAGDEAVGYCSLERYFRDENTTYIDLLGVRPDYHGKKVGKALVLQCIKRTIELGYPRIDLHTWSGNTEAVPLYKKCGYLWEDRSDSTHLVNFIPQILNTDLFKDFFKKADWYEDSTRLIEIVPDGVKVNAFEVFGYSWEKDGETLAVGFERTGRQMRYIETNDYKIELMAENHELAYGLNYHCTFLIENKTGKELNIKINGRNEDNIKFEFTHSQQITGTKEITAPFFVDEITEPLDKWKVLPCLLCDIEINGQKVTFGMGIEAKFPLILNISTENKVQQKGMEVEAHINIHSTLLQDGEVSFNIPSNNLISFSEKDFYVKLDTQGKTSISTKAVINGIGYEAIPITYKIKLKNGTKFSFSKPLHYINQDLTRAFASEDDYTYSIKNGPWGITMEKQDSDCAITHLTSYGYNDGYFSPPKFGKPYDDEFNLLRPTIKMYQKDTLMVMEAEFVSKKFSGMVITQYITLSAAGFITRKHKIENRGNKSRKIMVSDTYWIAVGNETTFNQNGVITQNHSNQNPNGYGFQHVNPSDINENWIFEASVQNPKGYCWSPKLKPSFMWGSGLIFEIDAGEIAPNQVVETEEVMFIYGVFFNFGEFRKYALKMWDRHDYIPVNRVEIMLNNYNPFIFKNSTILEIFNNREEILEGEISVSSVDNTTPLTQQNPPDEITKANKFELKLNKSDNISMASVNMNFATHTYKHNRIMFFPSTTDKVKSTLKDGIYSIDNGQISFKTDPAYGMACYSLIANNNEWLTHRHPKHEPFGWWNPFIGGVSIKPPNLNWIAVLKEDITAEFTEITDNYNNKWYGIKTVITVKNDDDLRNAVYETYHVTMPGLPVMCTFFRFINHTGVFKDDVICIQAYLNVAENTQEVHGFLTDKNQRKHHLHFGTGGVSAGFENVVKLSGTRKDNLYIFHGNKNNGKSNNVGGDNKVPLGIDIYMEAHAANTKTFTSSPLFMIITNKNLPFDAFDDLERISFE